MSEFLTIDTGTNTVKQEKIEPLPLYDENYFMLKQNMPEMNLSLINSAVTQKLIKRLKLTMAMYNGIGLSANQCGVAERVFVIGEFVCINPKIIGCSAEVEKVKEGCLSYPGLFVMIPRNKWIDVEYIDENGQVQQRHFEGVTAQAYQHELDHMNGVSFVDKVGPVTMRLARQKQQKLIKKIKRNR